MYANQRQCINNEKKTFHNFITPEYVPHDHHHGEITFQTIDEFSNDRVQHVRCMEDTSLRIASFSSDRLDGPDRYTRDFKYPRQPEICRGVKSGDRRAMVPAAPANDSVFPERLYQECLNWVRSVTGCSILHERDI
ncbi:hypothetical protein TNCV_3633271 [Trichonephila clavipes]|nr:hypothetical protein TNCV_3633271 [Trichonephila clavipes]